MMIMTRTMMMTAEGTASDYDTDILLWSERQAELLRRRAAKSLDWDNLAEEIVYIGRMRAVGSHLVQAVSARSVQVPASSCPTKRL
jgi:hypothetical protein